MIEAMYDLHCHILPAIDDGSKKLADSVEFARLAASEGIHKVVATPHIRAGSYENTRGGIEERLGELRKTLRDQAIDVEIVLGAEVYLSPDVVDGVIAGELPTYGGSGKYFLFELPDFFMQRQVEEYVFRLRTAGITPIIAHPERNPQLMNRREHLDNLVRMGSVLQITAMSVTGRFGKEARKAADELLDRHLVHIVASDAHNTTSRPLKLREAYDHIAAKRGPEAAERLLVTNPRKVLEGEPLDADPGLDYEDEASGSKVTRFLSRLLGF